MSVISLGARRGQVGIERVPVYEAAGAATEWDLWDLYDLWARSYESLVP